MNDIPRSDITPFMEALRLCQRFVGMYANASDAFLDERVVQNRLLLPHSGVDLGLLDKLADKAVTPGSRNPSLPYFQARKARSDYRLRNSPRPIERVGKATQSSLHDAQAKADAVLAMANWQLGQKDAAREMLTKGEPLAPGLLLLPGKVDLGEAGVASAFAQVPLNEAKGLLQSGPTTDANNQNWRRGQKFLSARF
ncbi:MAG: hypothetical protein ABSE48_20485 [Verrucomicrobiota bacterium]|jgi:hypothetical protein